MKTALVTGVSRGTGLTIVRELGVNGYQVAVMATRSESFYPESIRTLQDAGISYAWYAGDAGKSEDKIRIIRETTEHSREVHALVNNVGVAPKIKTNLLDMTEESFSCVIGANIKENIFMTQTVARQMIRQPVYEGKRGTIINVSSCSSQVSSVNRREYCASKAEIFVLTKLFADRPTLEGVFVCETGPGTIRTDIANQVEEKYTELIKQGMFPTARWGVSEDTAKAVRAFCFDDFCYTTGNYIDVDGGSHIRRLQDVVSAYGY